MSAHDTPLLAQERGALSQPVNPIFERVTRQKGQFDEHAGPRAGLIIGAVIFGAAILSVVVADMTKQVVIFLLPMFLSVASYLIAIGVPAFTLVFAAVMVNRLLSDQSLMLMLVTPLSADKILLGLVDGLYYRLRFVQYIGLALIPTACIAVAEAVGYAIVGGGPCLQAGCHLNYGRYLAIGGLPALIVAMFLVMNFAIQFWGAVVVGLWICLRAGQSAFMISAVLALVPVVGGFLFAYLSLSWQSMSSELPSLAMFLAFIALSPLSAYGAGWLARRDSIKLIESRALFRSSISG